MCRVLGYLGEPILLDELFYQTDNSLVKQVLGDEFLNLAGFGMYGWEKTTPNMAPSVEYKTLTLPIFDRNLQFLAKNVYVSCLLAHIRGVIHNSSSVVSKENLHPFKSTKSPLCFAHNGFIPEIDKMKKAIIAGLDVDLVANMQGTIDSVFVYYLLLQQLRYNFCKITATHVAQAIVQVFKKIKILIDGFHVEYPNQLNLFISNGEFIVTTRLVINFGAYPRQFDEVNKGYLSLWYARGERYGLDHGQFRMQHGPSKRALIVSSEPLTQDASTWLEVPEYSILIAERKANGEITISFQDIDI